MNKPACTSSTNTPEWRHITPREAEEIAFRLRFLAAGVSEVHEDGDRLSEDAVCGLIYLLCDIADMLAPRENVQQKKEGEA